MGRFFMSSQVIGEVVERNFIPIGWKFTVVRFRSTTIEREFIVVKSGATTIGRKLTVVKFRSTTVGRKFSVVKSGLTTVE